MVVYLRVIDYSILKILTVQQQIGLKYTLIDLDYSRNILNEKPDDTIFLIYAVIVFSLFQLDIIRIFLRKQKNRRHYFSHLCGTFFPDYTIL